MRHFAMTGIETAASISRIFETGDMRATPPSAPDVGGHALERHHGGGAGVLGDLRLLGVDDVHDDAALEHLGEADLHAERVGRERGRERGRGHRISFRSSDLDERRFWRRSRRARPSRAGLLPARGLAGELARAARPRSRAPSRARLALPRATETRIADTSDWSGEEVGARPTGGRPARARRPRARGPRRRRAARTQRT